MKKALILVGLIVTAQMALAQGDVLFANISSIGPVKQWTSTSDPTLISVPKAVGTTINGRVTLLAYYNSTTADLTPLFTVGTGGNLEPNYQSLSDYLAANSGWMQYSTVAIRTLQNGVYNGGVLRLGTDDGRLGASPDGANARYAVVAWTGSYTTFDLALADAELNPANSFLGISSIFTTTTGNPYLTPPETAVLLHTAFTGMTLAPVGIPEPAAFALAGLGAAALMICRRRR